MGLVNRSSERTRYLSVFNGKFAEKVDASTPGAISRENKLGNQVHELHYDAIENVIIQSGKFENTDYGVALVLDLVSDGEPFKLSLPSESRYAAAAMWKLPFANPDLKFDSIGCYSFTNNEGKQVSGLSFIQG